MEKVLRSLQKYSRGELLGMIPRGSYAIVSQIEQSHGQLEDVEKLAAIVLNLHGERLLTDPKLRSRLISALCENDIAELLDIAPSDVRPNHYRNIELLCDKELVKIAHWLGFSIEGFNQPESSVSIEQIKSVTPTYGLYPYQKIIAENAKKLLQEENSRFLIHLPTGAGKTRTAMHIIAEHLKERADGIVLWLADKEELCVQAFNEFTKAWRSLGDRELTCYGFFSESNESLGGIDSGMVVLGLQKLIALRKNDERKVKILLGELSSKVTLIVFDEAHKAVASVYKEITDEILSSGLDRARLIGLTATPGRTYKVEGVSESDKILSDFFHNKKLTMSCPGFSSPIDYLVHNGFLAKAEFKSISYKEAAIFGHTLSNSTDTETNAALSENKNRNETILNICKEEVSKGSKIILFACTVEHSIALAVALNYCGIPSASVETKSDRTKKSRRQKIARFRSGELSVLVNYGVLTAGFDEPSTNVAIIAKPTSSLVEYLQMAGRAMRGPKSGGNKTCSIYTVIDHLPHFNSINKGTSYWNSIWTEVE